MKKIVLAAAALALTASTSYAVINGTAHDLSASGALTGAAATQKCVYCHTPHNGTQNIPLWNRNAPGAITVYNSTTLTAAAQGATVSGASISAFCMSCHDGATSMGSIKNLSGGTDNNVLMAAAPANPETLTNSLANDHPVGFNYDSAVVPDGALVATATVKGAGSLGAGAFFGASTNDMECATCHKVHDDTLTPFLRISNAGSNLCLACHIK